MTICGSELTAMACSIFQRREKLQRFTFDGTAGGLRSDQCLRDLS